MEQLSAEQEMALQSGIAAFETKQFARAQQLLFSLAEELAHPEAQYRMAIMCQNGLGMVVNSDKAYNYMRQAAEHGHAMAQHGLGFMYMEGECVEQDEAQAITWFTAAAEQGLAGSMTTLAMLYEQGRGVAQNHDLANYWYKQAGFA